MGPRRAAVGPARATAGRGPRPALLRGQGRVLVAVALGGAVGAAGRYGAGLLWPNGASGFPWTTLLVNVVGCALMGVLMVVITEARTTHPLVRPFLGTGVLGGFTTFSTYAADIQRLTDHHRLPVAFAYLALTPLAALLAVAAASALTRRVLVAASRAREGT
ncbi:CrcB family protein [Streptomyces sp. NA04227]|uniref:fluoride efflux transporter FluC n=1 Tax=Streptomyces sp. NA04227 TaxID=2742136 RepID=UPI0015928F63|nr:CrcB family protein [Streptomyces sp. NA04227]QKW07651.1 CrcB family protein [Streptomyces sp. NA04227]